MAEVILQEKESTREDDLLFINDFLSAYALYKASTNGVGDATRFILMMNECFDYAKKNCLPNPLQVLKIKDMIQMMKPELRYAEKKGCIVQ